MTTISSYMAQLLSPLQGSLLLLTDPGAARSLRSRLPLATLCRAFGAS